jgi:hypothetical protein
MARKIYDFQYGLVQILQGRQAKSTEKFCTATSACRAGWRERYSPSGFRNLSQSHRVFRLAYTMTDEDERELASELARLQQEHRDLDAAIDALHHSPAPDLLRLQRLKKRKLQLRDRIAFIEDQITPDIIA